MKNNIQHSVKSVFDFLTLNPEEQTGVAERLAIEQGSYLRLNFDIVILIPNCLIFQNVDQKRYEVDEFKYITYKGTKSHLLKN